MKVYDLLDRPEKWTQKEAARNNNDEPVGAHDPDAVKWCLIGAIQKCYGVDYPIAFHPIRMKIRKVVQEAVSTYNDTHTYEEVIALAKELDV